MHASWCIGLHFDGPAWASFLWQTPVNLRTVTQRSSGRQVFQLAKKANQMCGNKGPDRLYTSSRQTQIGGASETHSATRFFKAFYATLALVILTACGSVPLDAAKPVSYAAPPPQGNALNALSDEVTANGARGNAVIPLNTGNQALGARLRLIETAEDTLDLQYFLLKPDYAGAIVAASLISAADRGVRIRFLLDDVFTTASDDELAVLNAHPNIDVRIYNPSPRPGAKFLGFVSDFNRVNRRMHNKSFTADGAWSIVGGRNIADEYFEINQNEEFADFDLVVTGTAVAEIAKTFDLFWNDGWAVPLEALRDPPSVDQIAAVQEELFEDIGPARDFYERAISDPFFDTLGREPGTLYFGKVDVVTDVPQKLKAPVRGGTRILAEDLLGRIKNASQSVIILTPYFVPEDYGTRLFSELAERGVSVQIVTNSIASTNHVYTHAGYRRHRSPLVLSGVQLNEVRADPPAGLRDEIVGEKLVLHSKMVIIDEEKVFAGSLNFDPRSIKLNSELGVYVHNPSFAKDTVRELDEAIDTYTYSLTKTDENELAWLYTGSEPKTLTLAEPGASFGKLFVVWFTTLLGVELQL